jgi:hypothetical protein
MKTVGLFPITGSRGCLILKLFKKNWSWRFFNSSKFSSNTPELEVFYSEHFHKNTGTT